MQIHSWYMLTETEEVEGQNEFRPIYGIKNINKNTLACAAGGIFFFFLNDN